MRRLLSLSFVLLLSFPLLAATPEGERPRARHFIVTLADGADAAGLGVQKVLGGGRLLVFAPDEEALQNDARVISLERFDASKKVFSSVIRAAANRATVDASVVFHDDVSFEAAQKVVLDAGGSLQTLLPIGFDGPHRLQVKIPATSLATLADDDAVLSVSSRKLVKKLTNAVAAQLSHVTPLFTAPYNLDGTGVAISESELGAADDTHPEFGGRLILHLSGGSDRTHATHVAGTMIASGLDSRAKGMAPGATLHEFDANVDVDEMQAIKDDLPKFNVVADNNSWDYSLGWQVDPSTFKWIWYGAEEEFGAYDPDYSTPYEQSTTKGGAALFIHAAGNDAQNGHPTLSSPWSPHLHAGADSKEIFCYSQNGSGNDCPAPTCSAGVSTTTGEKHCEVDKHATYGPATTVGLIASVKNVVAVGSVDANGNISSSSGRGPTLDGRIKPEVVAKGICQFSTWLSTQFANQSSCSGSPPTGYGMLDGTSMAAPVVTGITALITQQYRRTFGGLTPSADVIKALLIAGATDLGNAGPDFSYGFGLADAKSSVDLIIADNATGSRIRSGVIRNAEDVHIPMTLAASQNVRVVLEWFDPDVLLTADDLGGKTLLNDLDIRVVGPDGATTLPYVLNASSPASVATRGVNTADTTEEVEIKSAAAGVYDIVVHGSVKDVRSSTQHYVVIANAALGTVTNPPVQGPRRRSVRH